MAGAPLLLPDNGCACATKPVAGSKGVQCQADRTRGRRQSALLSKPFLSKVPAPNEGWGAWGLIQLSLGMQQAWNSPSILLQDAPTEPFPRLREIGLVPSGAAPFPAHHCGVTTLPSTIYPWDTTSTAYADKQPRQGTSRDGAGRAWASSRDRGSMASSIDGSGAGGRAWCPLADPSH